MRRDDDDDDDDDDDTKMMMKKCRIRPTSTTRKTRDENQQDRRSNAGVDLEPCHDHIRQS